MKKGIRAAILLLAISGISWISVKLIHSIERKNRTERTIARLPAFEFTTLDNGKFSNAGLESRPGKLIINFFSPDCEHCQYMAASFSRDPQAIKDATILMVTIADSASVADFSRKYGLAALPNLVLLRDTHFRFGEIFGSTAIPGFFVYEHGRLVKKIAGETSIQNLLSTTP